MTTYLAIIGAALWSIVVPALLYGTPPLWSLALPAAFVCYWVVMYWVMTRRPTPEKKP